MFYSKNRAVIITGISNIQYKPSINSSIPLITAKSLITPVPDTTIEIFNLALPQGEFDESECYGPYNALLGHLIPIDEKYVVVPQSKREKTSAVDFTTVFIVRHKKNPVFFVEALSLSYLQHPSKRSAADAQVRSMFYTV